MNKLLSLVFAAGFTAISAAAAYAMPVAPYGSMQARLTIQVAGGCDVSDGNCGRFYSSRHPRYRQAYWQAYRRSYYYRGYASNADPFAPGSGFCTFGSYVACISSGAYCLQRCY